MANFTIYFTMIFVQLNSRDFMVKRSDFPIGFVAVIAVGFQRLKFRLILMAAFAGQRFMKGF